MRKTLFAGLIVILLLLSGLYSEPMLSAKEKDDFIKKTALEIIKTSKYCVLVSEGSDGYPNPRMMDPFPPDDKWIVWMGTNYKSRKVKEILNNNKISLYYESPGGDGYVILKGTGSVRNCQEEKLKYFKKGWKEFYPGNREGFTLIKFIAEKLEIVSYKNGLLGDKVTWEAPSVILKKW